MRNRLPWGVLAGLIATALAIAGCLHQTPRTERSYSAISVCSLLGSADAHDGREVTTYGTYRYGFEWTDLYCLRCAEDGLVWVELEEDARWPQGVRFSKDEGTLNVVFRGRFETGQNFGHENGYRSQLRVTKILDARFVDGTGVHPLALPPKVREKVCHQ
jgi:hypothetical protein